MKFEYIIVQAGGKGARMQHLTLNKPKALIPIENLPILFHLFKKYPDKKFIIIGDYKIDVLKKYLRVFSKVKYLVIDARGSKGTCAGVREAMNKIPESSAFMLIWSDLILPDEFKVEGPDENYIGLSKGFRCRWRYENDIFEEQPSEDTGVAGVFVFKDKEMLSEIPQSGEFVKWLKENNKVFKTISLYKTKEYGLIEEYDRIGKKRCRPFNDLIEKGDRLIKKGIDEQGKTLAVKEKEWYKWISQYNYTHIPTIYSYEPFEMEKINGKNIFEYNFDLDQKRDILHKLVDSLKELHALGEIDTDYFSIRQNYLVKTLDRISKIRDLVPFANDEYIVINGIRCKNVFFNIDKLEQKINNYKTTKFKVLHGDCTFCNLMLRNGEDPVLIDPRGYFGFTKIYGDVVYDWAKLYYSIRGNYDQFNLKNFRLKINEDNVELKIESNGWEELEEEYLSLIRDEVTPQQIKLIHAIIWLSLTTYAWEDYDSICGAFYNGLLYLNEVV